MSTEKTLFVSHLQAVQAPKNERMRIVLERLASWNRNVNGNGYELAEICEEAEALVKELKTGCRLCNSTGTAFLDDPWGGVTGTCPDCHGTGKADIQAVQAKDAA